MSAEQRSIRFPPYCLHPTQGLSRGNREIRVTPKSLAVLRTLAEHAGDIVTKDELFRAVWPDTAVSDAALSSCILELRHALQDDARRPRYIETLHRRGFRFLAHPAIDAHALETIPQQGSRSAAGPIVGRDSDLQQISEAVSHVRARVRQVVFVTGEAGIGKTSLVETFIAGIADPESWHICRADCVEQYGAGEAYRPLFDALARLCRQPEGDSFVAVLRRYAPTWLAQLPTLQTPAELRVLQRRTAGATPERMLRELTDALEAMTVQTRIVLWLEDLHWSDPSTLNWIASFARRPERAGVLLLATYRHEEAANPAQSPHALVSDLCVRGLCREVALAPLGQNAVIEYVTRRFPAAPGADALLQRLGQIVYQHTEGNPLFLVNVLNDLLGRGILISHERGWTVRNDLDVVSLAIPGDVRRTIERQLDRLNEAERRVLEVASVVGATFSGAIVASAADVLVEAVEGTLSVLARRNAFVGEGPAVTWPDGTVSTAFHFLHALYREVLAQRLSAGRRMVLHRRIGMRMEAAYGERASEIASELAVHFEQAADSERAVRYFQRAGEADRRRSAHMEAQKHFQRALALLDRLPATGERTAREVTLRIGLGGEMMATRGFGAPEVADCYARARDLCRRLDATPQITPHVFPALWGLWIFYNGRGPVATARELAGTLLELARQSEDPPLLLQAHHALWATALRVGDLRTVRTHASAGLALYDAHRDGALAMTYGSHDAAACARVFSAWADALAGRTETAARALDAAIAHARDVGHPFTLAVTLAGAAGVLNVSRDAVAARERASEAAAIARDHSFALMLAWASTYEGRALTDLGDADRGLSMMREGVAAGRATGSSLFESFQLALFAEAQLRKGWYEASAQTLEAAFAVSERSGEQFAASEFRRVTGELRLARSGDGESRRRAEEDFRAAIEISGTLGATLLTLRASVSLARLLAGTTRSAEALALLAAARREVTEGVDLPDVTEATALLAAP